MGLELIRWRFDGGLTLVVETHLCVKKPAPPETHQRSEPLLNTTKRAPARPRNTPATIKPEQTLVKTVTSSSHTMVTRGILTRSSQDQGLT